MRIAMLSWESCYSIAVGGLAVHVTELAEALVRLGHEVDVFTRQAPRQRRFECIGGVHYHRCAFQENGDLVTSMSHMSDAFCSRLREAEDFFGERYDIIHGHDWLVSRALQRWRGEHGRPVVLTMHSTEYGRCGNSLPEGLSRRIRDVEWQASDVADRVICVSRALGAALEWLYSVPQEKLTPIYNGVQYQRFDHATDPVAIRRRVGVEMDDPMVLFVGRLAWQKGPDLLLEAAPDVLDAWPETKFVFAGGGDMRNNLEGQAAAAGLFDSVRFLGHRSGSGLVDLFKSADVVCVPSRNEPFGIVVLEAWSARRPVVVSRNGGPGEFVRDQETGFVVSPERSSLSWGLGSALADVNRSAQLGHNGRREVEERFSWDTVAVQTEDVYEAACA
jgi:glycosyltransferase involved in cell wall biosynthesis